LTSEPETGEGLKELMAKVKALEAQRDRAMRKDPYFDYGQALLQIAIVLASVSDHHRRVGAVAAEQPAGGRRPHRDAERLRPPLHPPLRRLSARPLARSLSGR